MTKKVEKTSVRWVVALMPEANPIINALCLKKVDSALTFPIYKDEEEENWLVVSGIGQISSAAASRFLFEKSNAHRASVWINIGIAGSKKFNIGDLVFIDKVTSSVERKSYYPHVTPNLKLNNRSELITVDTPETNFDKESVYDMEGFSFFNVASKFTSIELIVILKVISDGPGSDLAKIYKDKISSLIDNQFKKVSFLLANLFSLSKNLNDQTESPKDFEEICEMRRFTFSQRVALKKLVQQWHARNVSRGLVRVVSSINTSSEIIRFLEEELRRH